MSGSSSRGGESSNEALTIGRRAPVDPGCGWPPVADISEAHRLVVGRGRKLSESTARRALAGPMPLQKLEDAKPRQLIPGIVSYSERSK